MKSVLLILIIYIFPVTSLITCPKQCICHENSIACSCERDEQSEIIITSLGSTYITSLVVHTCPKVTVSNGSFAGVVLVERLSFIGIERLYFEPHAFKDILQSPKQFVIDECHIPSLSPVSLAGLSHIDHLWFRNSKIDVIATEAFHYLTNIDYIYFHKMRLGRIERRAFSKMYQIDHLYFKQSVEIDAIDSEAFSKSQIGELIFDDTRIATAHDTFLLNAEVGSTVVDNSTVYFVPNGQKSVMDFGGKQLFSNRCKITNSIFNSICAAKFGCNDLRIENSKINRIETISNKEKWRISRKLNSFTIFNSSIQSIDPFSFANYSLQSLVFNRTTIGTIQEASFENSSISRVLFANSKIFTIESATFKRAKIQDLSFSAMDIQKIDTKFISDSSIKNLDIGTSKIENMCRYLLKDSEVSRLRVDNSRIQHLDPLAFYGSNKISELHLTANDISTISPTAFLSSNPADHPTRLILANNTIDCTPTQCSTNAFLLNSPKHAPLVWQIANNKCRPPVATSPCVSPRIATLDEYGIACRISWQVAECACVSPHATLPIGVRSLLGGDVSVLIVGDCERLSIGDPLIELSDDRDSNRVYTLRSHPASPTSINQLYVFRTSQCDLNQLPKSLKVLKVFHSSLTLNGPLGHLQVKPADSGQIWHFANTHLTHIGPHALANLHLSELTIDASRISQIPPLSTSRSQIDSLRIHSSHLETTQPLFDVTAALEMRDSVVFSTPRALGNIASAQLQNNTLLECCTPSSQLDDPRCQAHFPGVSCPAEQFDAPNHLKSSKPPKFSLLMGLLAVFAFSV